MNNIKKFMSTKNILIIIVLMISFLFVYYISPKIFLGASPRINPQFLTQLKNIPKTLANIPQTFFNTTQQQTQITSMSRQQLDQIPLKQVTKGVYAGEQGQIKHFKISQSEIDWEEITLTTKSGRSVTLRYPRGRPPAKEMLEIIRLE